MRYSNKIKEEVLKRKVWNLGSSLIVSRGKAILQLMTGLGLLLLPFASFSQVTFDRTYGGVLNDWGSSVQETRDGGYILVGSSSSFGPGALDVYLIKTDSLGNDLWFKTYGRTFDDWGYSVQETQDGGFIIAGGTFSTGSNTYDVYLIRTDSLGDSLWAKMFAGSSEDWAYSVQETQDGGYILGGWTSSFGNGGEDVFVIKTDSAGNLLWMKTYGGSSDERGYSIQETQDGGFIITGWTNSFGAGQNDVYLIRTGSSGDTLWTKTYGSLDYEYGFSVQETQDGGHIIAGRAFTLTSGSFDVYLIKTDSSGNALWTKNYGGIEEDRGTSVQQTQDGGYIVTGWTASYGQGLSDIYLLRTDSSGDTLWTRTFGDTAEERSSSVQETQGGGFIIVGRTSSIGAGGTDVYLIKTDGNGMVGIEEEKSEFGIRNAEFGLKQNHPNPFHKLTAISYQLGDPSHTSLKVYDITGRLVETLVDKLQKPGVYQIPFTNNQLPASGIYFYQLKSGDFAATKKLILLR
jgi:hypothetical protein